MDVARAEYFRPFLSVTGVFAALLLRGDRVGEIPLMAYVAKLCFVWLALSGSAALQASPLCGGATQPNNSCVTGWKCQGNDAWVPTGTLPDGAACTLSNGIGTGSCSVSGTGVFKTALCVAVFDFSIGGSVTGLTNGNSVVLQDGTLQDTVASNGKFGFATEVPSGTAYTRHSHG